MLEGLIIRLPFGILLLISLALLVAFIKQDLQNKRSFILDVELFNLLESANNKQPNEGAKSNSYKDKKKNKK